MIEHVTPAQAWEALLTEPDAQLVDVRTDVEWLYVGLPDLSAAAKRPLLIAWQLYPTMQLNAGFTDQLMQAGLGPAHHIFFICRSGIRSLAAAEAACDAGLTRSYNVADGFEGAPDDQGRRGMRAGWKASGLPWHQR